MAPPPTPSTPTPISKAIDALTSLVRTLIAHLRARGGRIIVAPANPGRVSRHARPRFCRQRIQQDGQWRDGDTSFLKVNVWRGQAEHLADSLSKGDRVMVTGRLRQRSWETPDGDKRSVTEIEADEVGASLKWATAKVERTSRRDNGERGQGRERQAERGGDFNDPPPW